MFAFGPGDRLTHTLSLVTDRMGETLYYATIGSDAARIGAEGEVREALAGELDEVALGLYLQKGDRPAPRSIYKRSSNSSLAHRVVPPAVSPDIRRYWSPRWRLAAWCPGSRDCGRAARAVE
jgi:hypothetical protein